VVHRADQILGCDLLNHTALIEIVRSKQYVNKSRNFIVMINDCEMGRIEDGGISEIPMEPGEHEIYLKIDWCRSNKVKFLINENERIRFHCGSPIKGWRSLNPFIMPYYIFFNRDKYLYLNRE
jgi:hypothetical protein